jgi:hypothetical protein
MLTFNLLMYPILGQDPLSIPYVIDISPCRTNSFYVQNPDPLVFYRTNVALSVVQNMTHPLYHPKFVNNEPTNCPILDYEFLDSNKVTLDHVYVKMYEFWEVTQNRIEV